VPRHAPAGRPLSAPAGRIASRFAEVVCPPEVRAGGRVERVIGEFELLLGSVQPPARRALSAALIIIDQATRLYPRARGRRFARVGDQVADRYVRALLARGGGLGGVARRLKGLMVMCYYELPEVKEEIGYRPDPYIAAVSRRRLASYRAQIQAGEAAVLAPDQPGPATPLVPPSRPARNGP
jgi:hypothetical protein